jgi:hypothetical protein
MMGENPAPCDDKIPGGKALPPVSNEHNIYLMINMLTALMAWRMVSSLLSLSRGVDTYYP